MRLVTNLLEKNQSGRALADSHRRRLPRQEYLFEPLGQTDYRLVGKAEIFQFGPGGG